MTQLTHNPLAEPPTPRGSHDLEPRRRSWLAMAKVNFPGNPIIKPAIVFGCPHLRAAVSQGRAIAMQLDLYPKHMGTTLVDSPLKARRLRLYLAAVERELDEAVDLRDAEEIVGIRDADGVLKKEWK